MYKQMITELLGAWFLPYTVETRYKGFTSITDVHVLKWEIRICEQDRDDFVYVTDLETRKTMEIVKDIPINLLCFLCDVLQYSMKGDE